MHIYWGLCDFGVGGRFSVVGCPHLVGAELTEGVNFGEKGADLCVLEMAYRRGSAFELSRKPDFSGMCRLSHPLVRRGGRRQL